MMMRSTTFRAVGLCAVHNNLFYILNIIIMLMWPSVLFYSPCDLAKCSFVHLVGTEIQIAFRKGMVI